MSSVYNTHYTRLLFVLFSSGCLRPLENVHQGGIHHKVSFEANTAVVAVVGSEEDIGIEILEIRIIVS